MSGATRLVSPALTMDAAEAAGRIAPYAWQMVLLQLELGESWALRDADGRAIAVGGICKAVDGNAFAWFLPGKDTARHLRPLIRGIRLTLPLTAYPRILAIISEPAGRRIAKMMGFEHVCFDEAGMEVMAWES